MDLEKGTSLGRKHKRPFESGWVMMKEHSREDCVEQGLKRKWVSYWEYNEESSLTEMGKENKKRDK